MGELQFDPWATGGTGNAIADLLTGRLANYTQGTHDPQGRVAVLELRRVRAGQLEAAAEFHARVRHPRRLLDEQRRAERLRRPLRPELRTIPRRAPSSIRARSSSSTAGATRRRGQAPQGGVDNRSPFAMPRINVAWDIDRQRQQRPARRLRDLLQPQHGQPRVRLPAHSADVVRGQHQLRAPRRRSAAASG